MLALLGVGMACEARRPPQRPIRPQINWEVRLQFTVWAHLHCHWRLMSRHELN